MLLVNAAIALAGQGSLTHLSTLAFVSELGDKSYFLAVILAVWCPWRGVRNSQWALPEQLLAASGSLSALISRALIVSVGLRIPSYVDFSLAGFLVVMLLAFAGKAWSDMRHAERIHAISGAKAAPIATPIASKPHNDESNSARPAWISGGFLGDFKAYDPTAYEAPMKTPPSSAGDDKNPFGHADGDRNSLATDNGFGTYGAAFAGVPLAKVQRFSHPASLAAAFAIPFFSVFLAESSDKSLQVFRDSLPGHDFRPEILLGASIGYMIAVVTASLLGFVMERQLSEPKLLFAATAGFCALALTTGSTAALQAELISQAVSPMVVASSAAVSDSVTNVLAPTATAAAQVAATPTASVVTAAATVAPSLLAVVSSDTAMMRSSQPVASARQNPSVAK